MPKAFKELDWDKINLYLKAGATQTRIAESLGINRDTLRDRVKEKYGVEYSAYSASMRSTGELLIEATQLQKALAGNITMLLWLGKVKLGQKEPDSISTIAVNQAEIDKDHEIMRLKNENLQLREKANADKPQTG